MIRDPRVLNNLSLIETVLFTSSTTYRVPTNAQIIFAEGLGGGGGGGGGARIGSTSTADVGSGGGGGGAPCVTVMMVVTPGSSLTVTVGAGGSGGAGRTAAGTGSGSNGAKGGSSRFGNYYFPGGRAGGGGTTTAQGAGGAGYIDVVQGYYSASTPRSFCGWGGPIGYESNGGGSYSGGGGGARGWTALDTFNGSDPFSGGLQTTNDLNLFTDDLNWYVVAGYSYNGGGTATGRDGGPNGGTGGTGGGGGGGSCNYGGSNGSAGGAGGNGEIRIWVFG